MTKLTYQWRRIDARAYSFTAVYVVGCQSNSRRLCCMHFRQPSTMVTGVEGCSGEAWVSQSNRRPPALCYFSAVGWRAHGDCGECAVWVLFYFTCKQVWFWIFTVQIGYGENNISVTIYRHRRLITGDYVCVFQNIGFALTTTSELTETACACTYCDFDWWLFWLVLTVYCWKKVYGLKID